MKLNVVHRIVDDLSATVSKIMFCPGVSFQFVALLACMASFCCGHGIELLIRISWGRSHTSY